MKTSTILKNVPLVEIYDKCERIYATKGRSSNYPKKKFVHKFTGHAKIYGLPDGSLLIKSVDNKRLWDYFEV